MEIKTIRFADFFGPNEVKLSMSSKGLRILRWEDEVMRVIEYRSRGEYIVKRVKELYPCQGYEYQDVLEHWVMPYCLRHDPNAWEVIREEVRKYKEGQD